MAGAVGGVWLHFRKSQIHSVSRLLVEAGGAGFFLGLLFPLFDIALNMLPVRRIGTLLSPLQLMFCPLIGVSCAMVCAVVTRRHFVES